MAKEPVNSPGRGSDQFVVRFPEGMRDRVAKLAAANGRSMNAELIDRLEKSFLDSDDLKVLEATVANISERLLYLERVNSMRTGEPWPANPGED
jgi:hypothetical protein